jgi:hypothetical protein
MYRTHACPASEVKLPCRLRLERDSEDLQLALLAIGQDGVHFFAEACAQQGDTNRRGYGQPLQSAVGKLRIDQRNLMRHLGGKVAVNHMAIHRHHIVGDFFARHDMRGRQQIIDALALGFSVKYADMTLKTQYVELGQARQIHGKLLLSVRENWPVENDQLALPVKPGGLSQRFYRGQKGQAANLPENGVRRPRQMSINCRRVDEETCMP